MDKTRWAVGLGLVSIGAWVGELGCDSEVDTNTNGTATTSSSSVGPSSSSQGGGGSGGTGGEGGMAGGGGAPITCSDIDGVALVAHAIYLGSVDWNGMVSSMAWNNFGANIDGLFTQNGDLTGHCQPQQNATAMSMNDGPDGLDNSWGKELVPIFSALDPTFEVDHNDGIMGGQHSSLLLKLDALGPTPDQAPIVAKLYQAAPLQSLAVLDGSDCWPVAYESLQSPSDPESALTVFATSSVMGNLWQSESTGTLELELSMQGFIMPLRIDHARLSMQLDADHQGATIGQISGVIETEVLVEAFRDVAGAFSVDLCEGTTFDSIANQLRQASDIMANGTQDPNATCNAISVGIGFVASAVRFGAVAPPKPPPGDPCP